MHDRYPAHNPRAAWRVYDGEAVIVSPDDSTMHSLNAVATVVWEAADGVTPLSRIIARLASDTGAPLDAVERDVTAFAVQLASRGLLSLGEGPQPGATMNTRESAALREYEAPRLLSEGIFETTALACGKLPAQGGRCNARPKAS